MLSHFARRLMSSSHFWRQRLDTAHTVVQKISQQARFDGEVDVLGYVARPPLLPGCTAALICSGGYP
jgi:hypothetical protein